MMNSNDIPFDGENNESEISTNDSPWSVLGQRSEEMTEEEQQAVIKAGTEFADEVSKYESEAAPCLLISGQLGYYDEEALLFENRVRQSCLDVFNYPPVREEEKLPRINVLIDSQGGMLDSAFKIVLFLSRYAKDLDVYVPRRAKSASTLIALGARQIYLSPFGELGPLDTQIHDPRHTTTPVSALDCYQSVDYVRRFGLSTIQEGFERLVKRAGNQVPRQELLKMAADFALGCVKPMFESVRTLDFGGWGRSLRIGEQYARVLLMMKEEDKKKDKDKKDKEDDVERAGGIAYRLVYGYTHHPFPIDYKEADRMGLKATLMEGSYCGKADRVVELCHEKAFVGFVSKAEAGRESGIRKRREAVRSHALPGDGYRTVAPAMANVRTPTMP